MTTDVLSVGKIFMPICAGKKKISLVVVFPKTQKIYYYGPSEHEQAESYMTTVHRMISDIQAEIAGKPIPNCDEWTMVDTSKTFMYPNNGKSTDNDALYSIMWRMKSINSSMITCDLTRIFSINDCNTTIEKNSTVIVCMCADSVRFNVPPLFQESHVEAHRRVIVKTISDGKYLLHM
jgi:hypothetical protein